MFGRNINRVVLSVILLGAALPVPAMTPALLSGRLGMMSAVVETPGPGLISDVWRALRPPGPLFADLRSEPTLIDLTEQNVDPLAMPVETVALEIPEIADPISLIAFPSFRPDLTSFPQSVGVTAAISTPSTSFSAVPEPAAWILLVAGFGLLGQVLRVRRREPLTAQI